MVRCSPKIQRPAMLALCLLILAIRAPAVLAADVTASVSRNQLVEGETLTLVLQTGDPQQSLDTDFSVLAQDFDILDQRSETQMSIVNGQQSAVVRVLITLEPRRSGQLVVPALQFPGASTAPIAVRVDAAPELAPGEAPPVFIELSLDPEAGPYYVHAQLSLTVRIFYQQNLTEAAINPPAPQPASVRLLDEIPFQAERGGKRYRVLERHYAIFPERSGELVIPPLKLTGRLIERPSERLWQPSLRGRRVRIESDSLAIEVQPRPAGFTGDHWLPARRITMSQQLSDAEALRVGEPVTRTVILDAVGLEENMIEEPVWPEMDNARIYPDQPQGISRDDGQWVLGHKEFRYAVVPEEAGELVLPEIRLDWWDTVSDQQRTAILPEHRVQVALPDLVPTAALPPESLPPGLATRSATASPGRSGLNAWRLVSAVLALLWLGTLFMYFRKSSAVSARSEDAAGISEEEAELVKSFRKACAKGDAPTARDMLRRWVRLHGPAEARGSVMDFAKDLQSARLRDAILDLDASSFSPDGDATWSGEVLSAAFADWRRSYRAPRRAGPDSGQNPGPDPGPDLYARAR